MNRSTKKTINKSRKENIPNRGLGIAIAGFAATAIFGGPTASGQIPSKAIQIFCNSNKDGTGECIRIDNNDPFLCVIIAGQTTSCIDDKKKKFDCVYIGDYQFSCKPSKVDGIEGTIDSNEFQNSFPSRKASDLRDAFAPTSKPAF